MKKIVLLLILSFTGLNPSLFAQGEEQQTIIDGRSNAPEQQKKPYILLISVDGFRYDYMEKYNAVHLKQLAASGVSAEAMYPSFPSITFPNHYTIVTGLMPAHHGLVGNNMFNRFTGQRYSLRNKKAVLDSSWYGGTPLWVLAEQQRMLSASYYWPGSEAAIKGVLPTYYYAYTESTTVDKRIATVKKWLELPEDKRPHFITFYFPEVDHAGHLYGPDAPQTAAAVHYVDSSINQLVKAVNDTRVPVNFIVVSDHGMKAVDIKKPLSLPVKIDSSLVDVVNNGSYISFFVRDSTKVKTVYNQVLKNKNRHMNAYLSTSIPEKYHFGKRDDRYNRIGDIILLAKAPYFFGHPSVLPGQHGFDPKEVPEMKAIFLAWGPQIRQGKVIPAFQNIHIYPLLANLLGLSITDRIDGDDRLVKDVLK